MIAGLAIFLLLCVGAAIGAGAVFFLFARMFFNLWK